MDSIVHHKQSASKSMSGSSPNIKPVINKWYGDRFEFDDVRCNVCGKLGSVVEFSIPATLTSSVKVRIGTCCLDKADKVLKEAILNRASLKG